MARSDNKYKTGMRASLKWSNTCMLRFNVESIVMLQFVSCNSNSFKSEGFMFHIKKIVNIHPKLELKLKFQNYNVIWHMFLSTQYM